MVRGTVSFDLTKEMFVKQEVLVTIENAPKT